MAKHLPLFEEHVSDVRITTATVDIQVMRIGTKQMTLAVFRQLPVKDIFDRYGNLLAPPWGWVNYDREGSAKPFVYSYDGILYRCQVKLKLFDNLIVKADKEEAIVPGHYAGSAPGEKWTKWVPGSHWVNEKREWVPNGCWLIVANQAYHFDGDFWLQFDDEDTARAHLANRLASVAKLKKAQQLFIGV